MRLKIEYRAIVASAKKILIGDISSVSGSHQSSALLRIPRFNQNVIISLAGILLESLINSSVAVPNSLM